MGPKYDRIVATMALGMRLTRILVFFLFLGTAGSGSALERTETRTRDALLAIEGEKTLFSIGHTFDSGMSLALGSPYPRYVVDVKANRSVVFRGYANARTESAEHTLSRSQYEAVLKIIRAFVSSGVRSASSFGYASIHFTIDGKSGSINFDRTNIREYVALRQALEEYLRTKSYRCPVANPVRSIGSDKRLDICAKLVEFEDLI